MSTNTSASTNSDLSDRVRPVTVNHESFEINGMGPVERANLVAHLGLISQRLAEVETRLKGNPERGSASKSWLEFSKVLLGGWPAFGLLFLLLFYAPVRDALNAIPDKVRSAEEIGVLGVSLKNRIRVEAEKIGAIQLSETLPTLTPAAVEFLLRGSRGYNSLISYSQEADLLKTIWLPSEQTLRILEELESKKLIAIELDSNADDSVAALREAIAEFRRKYPVREEEGYNEPDQVRLELANPTKMSAPRYSWQPTELGKNAVNVILKAVSAQLTPNAKNGESSANQ